MLPLGVVACRVALQCCARAAAQNEQQHQQHHNPQQQQCKKLTILQPTSGRLSYTTESATCECVKLPDTCNVNESYNQGLA